MSIEEARTVAAAFKTEPSISPPRTITDVLAAAQRQFGPTRPSPLTYLGRLPPNTTDRDVLADFYLTYGLIARVFGTVDEESRFLTTALKYARPGGSPAPHQILYELALAARRAGQFARFVEYIREAIDASPDVAPRVTYMSLLTMTFAAYGDIQRATTAQAATARLFHGAFSPDGSRLTGSSGEVADAYAAFAQAQATMLEAAGRHASAEELYRRAEAFCEAEPSDFARKPRSDSLDRTRCARRAHLSSGLVRTLIRQGRLVEAETEARRIFFSIAHGPFEAVALRSLSETLLEQGRYRESEELARAAVDTSQRLGVAPDSIESILSRAQLAVVYEALGAYREALVEHDAIRVGLGDDPEVRERLLAEGLAGGHFVRSYAEVLLRNGQIDRALQTLLPELERSKRRFGETHRSTGEIRGYLAQVYAAQGDAARALREFRAALSLLLPDSGVLDADAVGSRAQDLRLVGILTAYVGLLADIRGTPLERESGLDAVAEAFRVSDVARGRVVQRALNASAARASVQNEELADLIRTHQDATRQLSALAHLAPDRQSDSRAGTDLAARMDVLQRAVHALSDRIKREFPTYAELIEPKLLTLEESRAMLRPDEALVTILVGRDRSFVWAVSAARPVAFASAAIGVRDVEKSAATLRAALDPSARVLGDIPALDLEEAHRMYRTLLEPVRSGWQHASSLIVVTNGPLGRVPLAILPTRPVTLSPESGALFLNYRHVPWLVRSHAVTTLPSVGSLGALRAMPPGPANRRSFVGFGDPYFSREQAAELERAPTSDRKGVAVSAGTELDPAAQAALTTRGVPVTFRNSPPAFDSSRLAQLPRLPETAEEIRSLARAMGADPTRDVFLGARANEQAVKALDLASYRIVAFATHGLVPGDLDGLTQPALALSAPDVAEVDGDGLLTMDEILTLRLNADWVVLSACNTASGQGGGADAMSGLGRAFFYAGARALLVSNWPVETTSAHALTTELFRRQRSDASVIRARALQQTQNWLIDEGVLVDPQSGKTVFSYAHPIFWAPFTLIGDGGMASR